MTITRTLLPFSSRMLKAQPFGIVSDRTGSESVPVSAMVSFREEQESRQSVPSADSRRAISPEGGEAVNSIVAVAPAHIRLGTRLGLFEGVGAPYLLRWGSMNSTPHHDNSVVALTR